MYTKVQQTGTPQNIYMKIYYIDVTNGNNPVLIADGTNDTTDIAITTIISLSTNSLYVPITTLPSSACPIRVDIYTIQPSGSTTNNYVNLYFNDSTISHIHTTIGYQAGATGPTGPPYAVSTNTGYTGPFVFANGGTLYENSTSPSVPALNYTGNQINANYIINASQNIMLPTTTDIATYASPTLTIPVFAKNAPTLYSYSITFSGSTTAQTISTIAFTNALPVNSVYMVYLENNNTGSGTITINASGLGANIKTTYTTPVIVPVNGYALITLRKVSFNGTATTIVTTNLVA